jgi:hypothetical protein
MFAIHVFAALFSFGTVMVADKAALAWVRGKRTLMNRAHVRTFHILTWGGLLALIISGAFLSLPMLGYLITQPLFIIKLLFVAVLIVNAFIIDRYADIATERPYESLSLDERLPLFVSGAVSGMSWVGALLLALVVFG